MGGLFVLYAGASVGIPLMKANHVSCRNGFFWEDHVPFAALTGFTKFVEIGIFWRDPTILKPDSFWLFVGFMMKFMLSVLGYVDGYTDATAITIAHSCDSTLAQTLSYWMAGTYLLGVVVGQWVVVACLAFSDPTHACFMKLIHMDALASCVSLPDEKAKKTWTIVNLARTFGEDIPQAIQQTLFLIYVKENYFMIVSVVVSLGSSMKAVYDALRRGMAALGQRDPSAPTFASEEGE